MHGAFSLPFWEFYLILRLMKKEETKKRKKRPAGYKNPARFRLDFIKENTLNTLWSIRMTRSRVWLVSLASLAAILALLWAVVAFTPLRKLLPGALKGDLRAGYVDTSLRLDSLERAASINQAYLDNIQRIFNDELPETQEHALSPVELTDSLLAASEAEMQFVRSYEEEERFNISVLAPIAAEGMVFSTPLPVSLTLSEIQPAAGTKGITATAKASTPVSAVYRGTVVSVAVGADGLSTVTIQHPNDFISVVQGLSDVFVEKGARVEAARRLGSIPAGGKVVFELWHKGSPLDPTEYIPLG